jgi:hypothetical protein
MISGNIIAAEMKFLRKTAQYTLYNHKKNQDIIKELNTHSITEKINEYKRNGYNTSAEWTDLESRAP